MPRYSDEFKEQVVRKMMPPNTQSVAQVHREAGISEPTLYAWRNRFRAEGQVVPANKLSPEECEQILAVCNEPTYQSLPIANAIRSCTRARKAINTILAPNCMSGLIAKPD